MKITHIFPVFLMASLLLFSCNKDEADPIENIAGEYSASFNFSFTGPGLTGTAHGDFPSVTITQTGGSIVVRGVSGTIDSHNNVTFNGEFLSEGIQTFTGTYNPATGVISGDLSGTYAIDLWTGYSFQSYAVTITSGTCTFNPND